MGNSADGSFNSPPQSGFISQFDDSHGDDMEDSS